MEEARVREAPAPAAGSEGSDRPIFVVACPRSGTTLLQLMLSAHPRIAIPPENRFVLEVYAQREDFGDLRQRRQRAAVAKEIVKRKKFRDFKLESKQVVKQAKLAPPTIGSVLGTVLREYATANGKPRWGDKRPLYLNHIPTLLTLFPDAQIVHIARDGRDCVASLKRMPWWDGGSLTAITRWVQSMNMAKRARTSLRPDQFYELRYEDLVADPRSELQRLCAFLSEEFSEAMLAPSEVAADAVPERKVWHARTGEAVSGASVNQWTEQLQPWEIGVIERLGRRHLQRLGYALSGAKAPARQLAAAGRHLAVREINTSQGRRADRRRARSYQWPVAAQLTSGQLTVAAANGELAWARAQ